ncbi:MAG: hypothetical protein M1836_006299 [Candelina mexicana]|nr:MAG: hypothetical protein M1836_006299 [Candelina mexicana]
MSSPGRSRKGRQENSDESHDSGYSSQPDLEVVWFPDNPHQSRRMLYERSDQSTAGLAPLARVMTFPVERDNPFVKVWERIRLQIHATLEQHGLDWRSISVFHRRQSFDSTGNDLTLVITAPRASWGENYESALEKCRDMTIHGQSQTKLRVELRDERVVFFPNEEGSSSKEEASNAEHHEHLRKPGLGLSIGVKHVYWSAGTIGGFVELESTSGESGRLVCALTNHHVARPTRTALSEKRPGPTRYDPVLNQVDKAHEAVVPGTGQRLPMSQPALKDHERMLQWLTQQTQDAKRSVSGLEYRVSMGDNRAKDRLLQARRTLQDCEQKYQHVSDFDLEYGTVFASSGYIKSSRTGGCLDWALVQIRKDRLGQNTLASARKVADVKHVRGSFKDLPKTCNRRESLNFDQHMYTSVVQLGKRTTATFGTVNEIRTDVKMVELPGQTLREIVIVGDKGVEFSQHGDSGAWVFNEYGDVLGMMYGGQETGDCGAFVTPIDEIRASILEMTGYRMRILDEID